MPQTPAGSPPGFTFGPYRLELEGSLLYRGDELLAVPPKAVETLLPFLENPGRVLPKEELLARVWPGLAIEEANLTQNIFVLRRALGDTPEGRPYIETLARRGYRFTVPVEPVGGVAPAPAPHGPPSEGRPRRRRHLVSAGVALGATVAVVCAAAVVSWLATRPPPAPPASTIPEAQRLFEAGRGEALRIAQPERSIAALERAVTLDPASAPAWSALALAYLMSVEVELSPRQAQPQVRQAAERALALDPTRIEGHLMLATVAWQYDWEPARAALAFDTVLRAQPDNGVVWSHFAFFHALVGDSATALDAARRARELDSESFEAAYNALSAPVLIGPPTADPTLHLDAAHALVSSEPTAWLPRLFLARLLESSHRWDEALAELEVARSLAPDIAEVWMDLGRVHARAGHVPEARAALAALDEWATRGYVSPFYTAVIAAELGDTVRAERDLAQAIEQRSWYVTWLRSAPQAAALRALPRYRELTAGVRFLDQLDQAAR